MRLMLPVMFLAGVGLIGLHLWRWVWMSSVDRDTAVITIVQAEFGGGFSVSARLLEQGYQVAYGRLLGLWADRLLYGCALVVGVVEGLWLRRRLENSGYHLILWTSAQACLVMIIMGVLVLATLPSPLPYRTAAAGAAAVFAWFGFAAAAGFPRTL